MSVTTLKIKKIRKLPSPARVYDLSVDDTHNFFVGGSQVLTSNCDSLSFVGQQSLRGISEECSSTCRFIMTCNYLFKIIPAVQSRCTIINLNPPIEETLQRVIHILKEEQVIVPPDQKPLLLEHVRKSLPDLRRIVGDLQKYSADGTLQIRDEVSTEFVRGIFQMILKKESLTKIRKTVIENEKSFSNDYQQLLRELFNVVFSSDLEPTKKTDCLLLISDSLNSNMIVVDKEIDAFAALIRLSRAV